MSIRRKSCEPCFRGRRKCDLLYPECGRCSRNGKECHYAYPPQLPGSAATKANVAKSAAARPARRAPLLRNGLSRSLGEVDNDMLNAGLQFDLQSNARLYGSQSANLRGYLGNLGDLAPVGGLGFWDGILKHIRSFPREFAHETENLFIHKDLFKDSSPRPLRAAFGLCAAGLALTDRNKNLFFRALDAEMSELLTPSTTMVVASTLSDDLARLQAMLLYQILRFFFGGMEQREVAERQEYVARAHGLRLIQRANTELADAPGTWETWILSESIRRTVFLVFKLYTMYAFLRYRECREYSALTALPVSTKLGSWDSRDAYEQHSNPNETVTYGESKMFWHTVQESDLGQFEQLLVMDKKAGSQLASLTKAAHAELAF